MMIHKLASLASKRGSLKVGRKTVCVFRNGHPIRQNLISIGMKSTDPRTGAGRPRTFDADAALEAALAIFWKKGYEGASLPALTQAMGMQRPSVYAIFGNKEALFRRALDHYSNTRLAFFAQALQKATAREVAHALLTGFARLGTTPGSPAGCLAVNSALACSEEAEPIRQELVARRRGRLGALTKRFDHARTEGDLAADVAPADLARCVMSLAQGMNVQAASGATRAELLRVAELAVANLFGALPTPVQTRRAAARKSAGHKA